FASLPRRVRRYRTDDHPGCPAGIRARASYTAGSINTAQRTDAAMKHCSWASLPLLLLLPGGRWRGEGNHRMQRHLGDGLPPLGGAAHHAHCPITILLDGMAGAGG